MEPGSSSVVSSALTSKVEGRCPGEKSGSWGAQLLDPLLLGPPCRPATREDHAAKMFETVCQVRCIPSM